jgi:hypothetical protein
MHRIQILSTLRRVVVWCLVQENPSHAQTRSLVVLGPPSVRLNLLIHLAQRLLAIVNPDIAHCAYVGVDIQLRDLAYVVFAW